MKKRLALLGLVLSLVLGIYCIGLAKETTIVNTKQSQETIKFDSVAPLDGINGIIDSVYGN